MKLPVYQQQTQPLDRCLRPTPGICTDGQVLHAIWGRSSAWAYVCGRGRGSFFCSRREEKLDVGREGEVDVGREGKGYSA